jgi:hypothetical protein
MAAEEVPIPALGRHHPAARLAGAPRAHAIGGVTCAPSERMRLVVVVVGAARRGRRSGSVTDWSGEEEEKGRRRCTGNAFGSC